MCSKSGRSAIGVRAYVDARYNKASFPVATAELEDMKRSVDGLYQLVKLVCGERLAHLRSQAGRAPLRPPNR